MGWKEQVKKEIHSKNNAKIKGTWYGETHVQTLKGILIIFHLSE